MTRRLHGDDAWGGLAVTPHLVEVNYDPRTDFSAIIKLVTAPLVLVVNASLPVNDVHELIALVRKEPAQVLGGSFGVGSNSHLALILFNHSTGLEISHTAHPGGFETTSDLVMRGFDLMFEFPPVILGHVTAGRLKPLAVTGTRRSTALPHTPTQEEAGIRGVEVPGGRDSSAPRAYLAKASRPQLNVC